MKIQSRHVIPLIWIVAAVSCLLMIPNYFLWTVVRQPAYKHLPNLYNENSSEMVYWVSAATGARLEKVSFVILALCFKLLPVFILILFSVLLIINIHHARQLRERLRCRSSSTVTSSSSHLNRELRTTTMLVFITSFTVLVEFPQGLFFIASGIDKNFFSLYSHLGDIWDITSISSSFITFIMYCSMSQQFRMEMVTLLLPRFCSKLCHLQTNINALDSRTTVKPRGRRRRPRRRRTATTQIV